MAGRFFTSAVLLATTITTVVADLTCGNGQKCPQGTPCCSAYGACGVGAYCFAGCDPANSFSLDACMPQPICKSATYTFDDLNDIQPNTKYLNDASKANWVSSGTPLAYNGQVLLTLSQGSSGTLLKSTHYVWYGKITARFKTSAGKGVVTAFILLGDAKDEIDFEFVGSDLTTAQTNFYSLGVTNYNNGKYVSGLNPDSYSSFHTYEIDWQPDTITWSIDGQQVRTLNRADTWNATANRFSYPQTPCQVQLSVWPAGLPGASNGTVTWAGGYIDWNSQYMTNGYYYAAFDSVTVQCYNPPAGADVTGSNSYIFDNYQFTNQSVEVSNKNTVLSSFQVTGLNNGNTNSNVTTNTTANSVPGLSGVGSDSNRGSNSSSSGTSGASGTAGTTLTATGSASTGFVQGSGGMSGATPITGKPEQVLQGSLFAVIVAIACLCVL